MKANNMISKKHVRCLMQDFKKYEKEFTRLAQSMPGESEMDLKSFREGCSRAFSWCAYATEKLLHLQGKQLVSKKEAR